MTEAYANDYEAIITSGSMNNSDVTTAITLNNALPTELQMTGWNARIDNEIVRCTTYTNSTSITVTRASENASRFPKATHAAGATLTHVLTKGSLDNIKLDTVGEAASTRVTGGLALVHWRIDTLGDYGTPGQYWYLNGNMSGHVEWLYDGAVVTFFDKDSKEEHTITVKTHSPTIIGCLRAELPDSWDYDTGDRACHTDYVRSGDPYFFADIERFWQPRFYATVSGTSTSNSIPWGGWQELFYNYVGDLDLDSWQPGTGNHLDLPERYINHYVRLSGVLECKPNAALPLDAKNSLMVLCRTESTIWPNATGDFPGTKNHGYVIQSFADADSVDAADSLTYMPFSFIIPPPKELVKVMLSLGYQASTGIGTQAGRVNSILVEVAKP